MKKIYIKLLGEGTKVFRPVPAINIRENIYRIEGADIYDPDDEIWEFKPGTYVVAEEQSLNGELVLIAVKEDQMFF